MRITLNESEIKTALVRYVAGQGVDVSGRNVEVSMTAGRGANGYTADIDITDAKPILDKIETVDTTATFDNQANTSAGLTEKTIMMNDIAGMKVDDEVTAVDPVPTKSIFDQ